MPAHVAERIAYNSEVVLSCTSTCSECGPGLRQLLIIARICFITFVHFASARSRDLIAPRIVLRVRIPVWPAQASSTGRARASPAAQPGPTCCQAPGPGRHGFTALQENGHFSSILLALDCLAVAPPALTAAVIIMGETETPLLSEHMLNQARMPTKIGTN